MKNRDEIIDRFLTKQKVRTTDGFLELLQERLAKEDFLDEQVDRLLSEQDKTLSATFTDKVMRKISLMKMCTRVRRLAPALAFAASIVFASVFISPWGEQKMSDSYASLSEQLVQLDEHLESLSEFSYYEEIFEISPQTELLAFFE